MAIAIIGGLIAATVLTLVFIPALYGVWLQSEHVGPKPDIHAPVDENFFDKLFRLHRIRG